MVSMGVFLWSRGAEYALVGGPNGWKSVTHIDECLFESRGSGLGCKVCGRNFVRFWVFGVRSGVGHRLGSGWGQRLGIGVILVYLGWAVIFMALLGSLSGSP
ncbi:hypothetical protein FEAC_25370 [Ferrimicrobium acidiphilum DSM 19497]|uniref:Transmembrane protein n=1 Tax=Ferrimicrobium acidiphilum DSM 19497 TaxID=1121877 RepID=A0A0D8FQZ1_9ACTN|nr:hypothetical protein FEAC_25370 [Ferrimicrobium acidiphilum DSM 19497]